jgi:hypothetical protein
MHGKTPAWTCWSRGGFFVWVMGVGLGVLVNQTTSTPPPYFFGALAAAAATICAR